MPLLEAGLLELTGETTVVWYSFNFQTAGRRGGEATVPREWRQAQSSDLGQRRSSGMSDVRQIVVTIAEKIPPFDILSNEAKQRQPHTHKDEKHVNLVSRFVDHVQTRSNAQNLFQQYWFLFRAWYYYITFGISAWAKEKRPRQLVCEGSEREIFKSDGTLIGIDHEKQNCWLSETSGKVYLMKISSNRIPGYLQGDGAEIMNVEKLI
ncbi:hypothetical protein EDD85DRAFT_794215 [Armillaria nabsnona]|nr:hypothetical protein EDD85DRAFT_794215 [Armillaria nabsnona]